MFCNIALIGKIMDSAEFLLRFEYSNVDVDKAVTLYAAWCN